MRLTVYLIVRAYSVMDTRYHDRAVWRNGILGNRLTRAVARKNELNDDDAYCRTTVISVFLIYLLDGFRINTLQQSR